MPMNRVHQRICRSDKWSRAVEQQLVPWVVDGVDLGDAVLEVGPGYGATTRVLARQVPRLTAVEIDPVLARRLRAELGADGRDRVHVLDGDGSALPLPDASFSTVVCFTMLHHMPDAAAQDRLFAQAHRVLEPGGWFLGSDSIKTLVFRLLHLFDTMVVVDPATVADRLRAVGFVDVAVDVAPRRSFRFRARKEPSKPDPAFVRRGARDGQTPEWEEGR